jgi:hypothetical protein
VRRESLEGAAVQDLRDIGHGGAVGLADDGSGLQFLQLALDQVFGVLCITPGKWSQPDGSTALGDDHEVEPHHQEALHRDVVDVTKWNDCRTGLTRDLGANELDTVPEDPQTLIAYGR